LQIVTPVVVVVVVVVLVFEVFALSGHLFMSEAGCMD
jgi:hypothetical protein